jgi:hypothetical protein
MILLPSIQRNIWAFAERFRRGGVTEGAASLRQIVQDLEALNRSSERDFLAVGEKLMAFRSTARQMASDVAAVTDLISGEHGRSASHALTRMLEHTQEIDAGIARSGQALEGVRELANRLRRAFSGLTHMVVVFRTLCTLTQIETARLGGAGAGLGHLAAEIRPLSESIRSSGKGVLEASERLDREVQAAIRHGSELRATQLKEISPLISSVLESMQSFEERRRLALESSDRQAAQYAAVSAAIDDLVSSLQFHDITRQQVEHVIEALRQVEAPPADTPAQNAALKTSDARAVLTLQSSQLAEAARLFAESIERIEGDLATIGDRLENASESVRALAGISGGDGNSFFAKMEAQFSAILKMLGNCGVAQAQMDSTAAGLESTIARMAASVWEIRGTEIQIQRISTNATIGASHLGSSGGALDKIAEIMHRLALESNVNTEEAAAALDAMRAAAARASGPGQAGTAGATNQVAGEIERALRDLHASSESSFARVRHIAELAERLAEDIGALRAGVSAGRVFAAVVARVREQLDAMGVQAGSGSEVSLAARQHLEHLAKSYTMQAQHDVHSAVLGTAAMPGTSATPGAAAVPGAAAPRVAETTAVAVAERPAPPENAAQPEEPASDGLGDNVELF